MFYNTFQHSHSTAAFLKHDASLNIIQKLELKYNMHIFNHCVNVIHVSKRFIMQV